jgi:FkbM family methyltransferase
LKKSIVKKLAYNPFVVRVFKVLGLRKLMRSIYYKFTKPRDNILKIDFEGQKLLFYVDRPINFRIVETAFSESKLGGEKPVLDFLVKNIKEGDVVFDVGANVGVHTVLMAKLVGEKGEVVSFEPEAETFNSLKKNISINELDNVITFPLALSDSRSEKNIYFTGNTGGFSLRDNSGSLKGSGVKLIPGDELIKEENLPIPNIVKIDVEGFEYEVIKGLSKTLKDKQCKIVICEVHPNLLPEGVKSGDIELLLKKAGFHHLSRLTRGVNIHLFALKR